jgi:hypothetical protein
MGSGGAICSSPSLEALPLKFPSHGARGLSFPLPRCCMCGCHRRLWSSHVLYMAMGLFVVPVHASYSSMLVFVLRCGCFSDGYLAFVVSSLAADLPLSWCRLPWRMLCRRGRFGSFSGGCFAATAIGSSPRLLLDGCFAPSVSLL